MRLLFKNEEMRMCVELMSLLKETGKLGYAIAKNTNKMRAEVQEYAEKRGELLKKYGTLVDEKRGRYEFETPEAQEGFDAELKEISEIELAVDICQIDKETFYGGKLTNNQMAALIWMVEGEGKPEEQPRPKAPAKKRTAAKKSEE